MKVQIALLLLIALFAASATAGYATEAPKTTCKYITKRKCNKIKKKIPVQKQKKIAYFVKQKYVKATKVSYKKPICKRVAKKVAYKKAQSYKKLIKYQVNKPSTRRVKYRHNYVVKQHYKKKHAYKVRKSCRRFKSVKVAYYKQHSKKYWKSYQTTCPSTRKVKKSKKVKAVRCYSCKKAVQGFKTIKVKVPTQITKTKQVLTGRFILSDKQDGDSEHPCYKKETKTVSYVVTGWKWGTKKVKHTYYKKATCHKNYLKTVYYYVTVPCKIPCTKKVQKVKTWKTKHYKTVKKPYTHYYFVTRYRYTKHVRLIKKFKYKYKSVPCVIKVWKQKYVTRFRYVTRYRTVYTTKTAFVKKYRTKYTVAFRKVKKYKYKKYTTYTTKNIKVCANIKTKVCKNDW